MDDKEIAFHLFLFLICSETTWSYRSSSFRFSFSAHG
jgi:hypothetical protein